MMAGNMLASFKLLIPSVTVSLLIALFLGTIMGMNTRVREVLYPVIYAFSVIPSILLSPFVLLMAPSLFSASVFLIVYNIMWATLFATITGIMTIDKRYLDKAATLELRGFKRLIKVILPAASHPSWRDLSIPCAVPLLCWFLLRCTGQVRAWDIS